MKNNQNGTSMVEMLGVMGIVSMVAIGAISLYTGIMDKYRISVTNQQIQSISKTIHELYVAKSNYKNLTTKVLIDENLAPREMVMSGTTNFLLNKMGGKTIVSTSTDNKSFNVLFSGLSKAACISVAKINPDPSGRLNFVQMKIGAANSNQTGFSGAPGILNASNISAGTANISTIAGYCVHKNNNAIEWEFY
jgi:type II secretory pathway pseudopilin PulG